MNPSKSQDAVEIEDISKAAAEGRLHRPAQKYRVRIDKDNYDFDTSTVTGRTLLDRAGKTPVERWELHMRLTGNQRRLIKSDETVDLTTPGLERFVTLPLDQTEG